MSLDKGERVCPACGEPAVVDYVTVITMGFLAGLGFGGLVLGPRVVVHNFVFHDGDDGRDGRE